jgi:phosphoenolpyruvate carboxykinase (ATP)
MDLRAHGLVNVGPVHANLPAAKLVERALQRGEGVLASNGALAVRTGKHTGRAPRDKYAVRRPPSQDHISWGPINQPMAGESFDRLFERVRGYFQGPELFVVDATVCADPAQRLAVRVITERAWAALFSQCLLIRPRVSDPSAAPTPGLVIYHAPGLRLDPGRDGTRSDVGIVLDFDRGQVVIAGTEYAGEIKKAVFTFLNYHMPERGVFPMHCAANVGPAGDTALLFGLSGTGKTTLSADPERRLIGDDEHGWSDDGIFNFEGGCYAKCVRLSRTGEPQIWDAIRAGCILENVVLDPATNAPNFDDISLTENTRAAYPIEHIASIEPSQRGGHPRHVLFLTCDAYGVLPPLSKLTTSQAQYHFLSGYTAKVAGTEVGVREPQATFSSCFAAPFLPRSPAVYARLLEHRLDRHGSQVWLVNTGWTGGGPGRGRRIALNITRQLVRAALTDLLARVSFTADPVFGVLVPSACPGVPAELLHPRNTWPDGTEFDRQARMLAELFQRNFKNYENQTTDDVRQAGPRVVPEHRP